MVGYEIARRDENTAPRQPSHAKDPTVEKKDGAFDQCDTPSVDVYIGESYL